MYPLTIAATHADIAAVAASAKADGDGGAGADLAAIGAAYQLFPRGAVDDGAGAASIAPGASPSGPGPSSTALTCAAARPGAPTATGPDWCWA